MNLEEHLQADPEVPDHDDEIEGEFIAPAEGDVSTSLWESLPPPQSREDRLADLLELDRLCDHIWEYLSVQPQTWITIRDRVIEGDLRFCRDLLRRPTSNKVKEVLVAAVSIADTVLMTADNGIISEANARKARAQLVPTRSFLIQLLNDLPSAHPLARVAELRGLVPKMRAIENRVLLGATHLVALAMRRLNCARDPQVEDLFQDGLLALHTAIDRLANPEAFTGYVLAQVTGRLYMAFDARRMVAPLRENGVRIVPEVCSLDETIEGTTNIKRGDTLVSETDFDETTQAEDMARMMAAVRELPKIQQIILTAAFGLQGKDEIKPQTLSRELGLPVDVVGAHYRSAMQTLRQKLAA